MSDEDNTDDLPAEVPKANNWKKGARGALSTVGGLVPFAGGLFSAAAGFWSESDQAKVNSFLQECIKILEDEMREKQKTLIEIAQRVDVHDEKIAARIKSEEYQSLVRKALRKWSAVESEKKRIFIRNILTNAASVELVSDDVVSLFLEWLDKYSEFHFAVIGDIYQNVGATRYSIWTRLAKGVPREDSAEADLYKLLIRDLSTGGVVRQHREVDFHGNYLKKTTRKSSGISKTTKSAFDDEEAYELTELGKQFVHYAMNEVTTRISYDTEADHSEDAVEEGL